MSADNWAICPKCKNKAAAAPPSDEVYRTLREDYELFVDEDTGVFDASYSASCKTCGFEFHYTHKEQAIEL